MTADTLGMDLALWTMGIVSLHWFLTSFYCTPSMANAPIRSCRSLNYSAGVFCFCVRAAGVILDRRYLMICCRSKMSILSVAEWLFFNDHGFDVCVSVDARHPYQVEKRPVTAIFSIWLRSNIVPGCIKAFHFKTGQTGGMRRNRRWPTSQYHRGLKEALME